MTELSDAVAPARERHRELIDAATAWLSGRADPDHLALICAGADDSSAIYDVTPTRWTRIGVHHVVRCDIPNWCSWQRTSWPVTICETLWHWFDFLHDSGRLDPRSDPVGELRKPLACYGGLGQDGRPLPSGAKRQLECECFLPYRETVELLNEIGRRSEWSGDDPLDVLRRAAGRAPAPRWSPRGGDGAALWEDGYDTALLDEPPVWGEDDQPWPFPGG